ncbi:MAG: MarR family transcriptional regulator [Gammaproteobacteria bacterium]
MSGTPRFNATRERSLGFALAELVRAMRRDFLDRNPVQKLTPELWRLLYCLDRNQGGRQTDLAAVMDVTPVTLGRMIDQLEKRGLVQRAPDPDDRRAIRVRLTAKAATPIARMHALVDETGKRAVRGLTRAEEDQFWRLLGRIRENLLAPRPVGKQRTARRRTAAGR